MRCPGPYRNREHSLGTSVIARTPYACLRNFHRYSQILKSAWYLSWHIQ